MTSLALDFGRELVIDLFAGGGGASLGLELAYRAPDVAVNHDPVAIAVHRANHPATEHFTCDVFEVDPRIATKGRPVGVLWASPDCRHHSKAKGGKPRSKRVRGLAWVVVKWAKICRPRVIHLENVEEFADWGPLLPDGSPCPFRKGLTYRRWVRELVKLGYQVEARELVAADYGTPTTRNRLYIIARCDGRPIVWPAPTHAKAGAHGLKPWRSAAECIDFTLPAHSIFLTKEQARASKLRVIRPLKHNTLRRIAKGLWRYVLNHPSPFIVPLRGSASDHTGTHPIGAPLSTISAGGMHHALVTPYLTEHANASTQRTFAADEPLRTQCAQVKGGHFALVAPTLVQSGYGERQGQEPRALDLAKPLGTVVACGVKHAVAAAHIARFKGSHPGTDANAPMPTITAGGSMERPAGAAHSLGLVAAHIQPLTHHGARAGVDPRDPSPTITAAHRGEQALVAAWMEQANTDMVGHDAREPVSTIVGKGCTQRVVNAYMVKYYRTGSQWSACDEPAHTIPTKARMGLVQVVKVPAHTIAPELRARAKACADFLHEYLPEHFPKRAAMVLIGDYVLTDITLRMLVPRELARAQGFPDSYIIEHGAFAQPDGSVVLKPITKTDQVRLIGNSVCNQVAAALASANLAALIKHYEREACIA